MNDPELPISDFGDGAVKDMRSALLGNSPEAPSEQKRHHLASGDGELDFRTEVVEDDDQEEVGPEEPRREWFVSTAFPLVAGTFGPLASLFSICAIVEGWRVRLPDEPGVNGLESEGTPVKDPHWLLGLNVASLILALIANLILLFNFAQRIRYAIAQPLTIILWYISGFTLVALLVITPRIKVDNLPTPHQHFSQSYYSGIISASLYLVLSTLLLVNLLTASPFPYSVPSRHRTKSQEKRVSSLRDAFTHSASFAPLTIPQRTLMLQSTFFTIYLGLGALWFTLLERRSISPLTPSSQQASEDGPNFNATMHFTSALFFVDYTLLTIGFGSDYPPQNAASRIVVIPYALVGILILAMVVGSVRSLVVERGKLKSWKRGLWKERMRMLAEKHREEGSTGGFGAEAFEAMRLISKRVERKRSIMEVANALFAYLTVWFIGAMVFYYTERPQQWTYPTALYFTQISLLTIGYGDYVPQSNAGRPFFVLWSLIAVPTVTVFISVVGTAIVRGVKAASVWVARRSILPEKDADTGSEGEKKDGGDGQDATKTKLELKLVGEIARLLLHMGKNGGGSDHAWEEWKEWLDLLDLEAEEVVGARPVSQRNEKATGWLSHDGPLLSDLSETEWVLARLCKTLEKRLGQAAEATATS